MARRSEKEILRQERQLLRLAKRWRDQFGEDLALGFCVRTAQIPLIEKCLKENSQKPLNDYIDAAVRSGIVF